VYWAGKVTHQWLLLISVNFRFIICRVTDFRESVKRVQSPKHEEQTIRLWLSITRGKKHCDEWILYLRKFSDCNYVQSDFPVYCKLHTEYNNAFLIYMSHESDNICVIPSRLALNSSGFTKLVTNRRLGTSTQFVHTATSLSVIIIVAHIGNVINTAKVI
jgi:hypothetical protein